MSLLYNPIISNIESSLLDQKASEINKITPIILMEEAGEKLLLQLKNDFKNIEDEKIAIVAGWGNNGGDALSLARKLFFENIFADVYIYERTGSELYEIQKNILATLQIELKNINELPVNIDKYTLIIDGVFGIGYRYRDDNEIIELFKLINHSQAKKIAIDVPSGLNSTKDISIKADYTYSIGYIKNIFFNILTRKNSGIIRNLKISFDINNIQRELDTNYINEIPKTERKKNSFVHKYSRGASISIGGMPGMLGSIIFSATSALKAGAGISLIITDKDNIIPINTISQSVIVDSFENLDKYTDKYNAILIGPGLHLNEKQKKIVNEILEFDKYFILDASFFTEFDSSVLKSFKKPPILTPHSQEFISFFKEGVADLKTNTIKTVSETAQKHNAYILLKESFLILSTPDGKNFVIDKPQRLLAQAGSGDILAGIITGLLSEGFEPINAILESIRVFHKTADYFNKKGLPSYSPKKFINLIYREALEK